MKRATAMAKRTCGRHCIAGLRPKTIRRAWQGDRGSQGPPETGMTSASQIFALREEGVEIAGGVCVAARITQPAARRCPLA